MLSRFGDAEGRQALHQAITAAKLGYRRPHPDLQGSGARAARAALWCHAWVIADTGRGGPGVTRCSAERGWSQSCTDFKNGVAEIRLD